MFTQSQQGSRLSEWIHNLTELCLLNENNLLAIPSEIVKTK